MTAMLPDFSKTYSYADYLQWTDKERVELIEGVPYLMTPAPSTKHQQIVRELVIEFGTFLRNKQCQVFSAPFDVRLLKENKTKNHDIYTVVQPDLVVVCDKSKLDKRGCIGTPDLVIEVLSPSTAAHDYIRKMDLYEKHGVKEYWIVQPTDEIVMVFNLKDSLFGKPAIYDKTSKIQVSIIEGFEINLCQVFS